MNTQKPETVYGPRAGSRASRAEVEEFMMTPKGRRLAREVERGNFSRDAFLRMAKKFANRNIIGLDTEADVPTLRRRWKQDVFYYGPKLLDKGFRWFEETKYGKWCSEQLKSGRISPDEYAKIKREWEIGKSHQTDKLRRKVDDLSWSNILKNKKKSMDDMWEDRKEERRWDEVERYSISDQKADRYEAQQRSSKQASRDKMIQDALAELDELEQPE